MDSINKYLLIPHIGLMADITALAQLCYTAICMRECECDGVWNTVSIQLSNELCLSIPPDMCDVLTRRQWCIKCLYSHPCTPYSASLHSQMFEYRIAGGWTQMRSCICKHLPEIMLRGYSDCFAMYRLWCCTIGPCGDCALRYNLHKNRAEA